LRRPLAILIGALLVAGGIAAAAMAGDGSAAARDATVAAGAQTSPSESLDEILERLVSDGVIDEGQAEAVGDALREHAMRHHHRRHHGHSPDGLEKSLDIVAEMLGIDEEALLAVLHSGRSIADIAGAHGVAASAVVDALAEEHDGYIDDLLGDGRITEEDAAEMRTQIRSRIQLFVDGDAGPHHRDHRFHDFGGRGFGFHGDGHMSETASALTV
jgi:polyhydroxyalkanoate synthesis regulator phasin